MIGDLAMATSHRAVRVLLGVCLGVIFLLSQAGASAETLMIQYTGLDITYDGNTISEVGNPDSLSSLVFKVNGVEVPPVLTSGIAIDLSIPGVTGLPITGGGTTSAAGGTLSLTLPAGGFVNLELGAAEIYFTAIPVGAYKLYFALGASAADVLGQALPIDGELGGDISVSFSTQILNSSLTSSGGYVTGFVASGTGEIEGGLIPEPSSIALVLGGLMVCLVGIRRHS
jgi:hypothetical protein